ncbi:hypothetical protein [Leadbettera azotonutricia]|uniref:Uncharacterized protein n=1 Tax=Leadbettera azotonutricia (strain ATCC BAA-888 / DSM 13862 / ZAS-9) TaxID=545695 RepID=F5YG05_LEAAZ|nr:hypothetical protein [Leadbettera azotonutricia]AEF81025.1 hypothetical protein TREAZ_1302 [Leadbettera azotonutricia ZAS-9]
MIILDSARKHGIADLDMLAVIAEPYVIAELREAPADSFLSYMRI